MSSPIGGSGSNKPSRFSKEHRGFYPLAGYEVKSPNTPSTAGIMSPNDAKIDIPLHDIRPPPGAGGPGSGPGTGTGSESNEKGGMYDSRIGRRKLNRADTSSEFGFDSDEPRVNRVGQFYQKVLNFSIITRYLIYVLPFALIVAIPIIIGTTVAPKARIAGVSMVWFFVWIEVVWLSLWCSKILAHFMPKVFQTLIGVVSTGTRKYALILHNIEIPLSLVGWTVTSLATFIPLMCQNPEATSRAADQVRNGKPVTANQVSAWMAVVRQILAACLVSSLIFLAERVLIQLISINYHRRQMNQRVKTSKRDVDLITFMYEASCKLFPMYGEDFYSEDVAINGALEFAKGGRRKKRGGGGGGHKRSGSSSPAKLFQEVGRIGGKITSAFGNVASEITGKQVFNFASSHSIVIMALEKEKSAEALARRIWMSCVVEGKDSLFRDDIVEVLGPAHVKEADECFTALDQDNNGDVSLDEMITMVNEIGRERRALAHSLYDVGQAIHALDSLLCTAVFVICVFVFIAFLNASFSTTLATAGTALLSLSFVFAVTCQEILGSCIFLFVKHPYDVGDRVEIAKEGLLVERISLLYTEFKRVTNATSVQIPNSVLNTLWIENITRSKPQNESITLSIAFDTSFEDIELLEAEMTKFVTEGDNARDFLPKVETELTSVADMSKLELRVGFNYKSNWANGSLKTTRRKKFMCALLSTIRRIPIYGPGGGGPGLGDIANPSYSVAISPDVAEVEKAKSSDAMDAKRMVPAKPPTITTSLDTAGAGGPIGQDEATSTGINRNNTLGSQTTNNNTNNNGAAAIGTTDWAARNSHLSVDRDGGLDNDAPIRRASTGRRRQSGSSWRDASSDISSSHNVVPSSFQPSRQPSTRPSLHTIHSTDGASPSSYGPIPTPDINTMPPPFRPAVNPNNSLNQSTSILPPTGNAFAARNAMNDPRGQRPGGV